MNLSPRFDQALQYASLIHAGLLGVASIALEYGADEDQAVAALLHDAGEDAGGQGRLDDIATRFGAGVAEIVAGCTDTLASPKPPWRERKEKYLSHLHKASARVRLVSAADKLYNARAILHHYRLHGENVWPRFAGGREGTLWYYHALVQAFRRAGSNELTEELDRVVTQLELLAGAAWANIA
jgi:(p)ppGpp synthase/HD superfamily hydrolase